MLFISEITKECNLKGQPNISTFRSVGMHVLVLFLSRSFFIFSPPGVLLPVICHHSHILFCVLLGARFPLSFDLTSWRMCELLSLNASSVMSWFYAILYSHIMYFAYHSWHNEVKIWASTWCGWSSNSVAIFSCLKTNFVAQPRWIVSSFQENTNSYHYSVI